MLIVIVPVLKLWVQVQGNMIDYKFIKMYWRDDRIDLLEDE